MKLEEEGEKVLKFFRENKMVANASKTALLIFRQRRERDTFTIKLQGEDIKESEEEKLLGVVVQNDLKWDHHVGKIVSELNYSLHVLSRLSGHLGRKELKIIAEGIIMSRVRYCTSVWGSDFVRFGNSDPRHSLVQKVQSVQNQAMRTILRKKKSDHVRISDMLSELGMLSVNQTIAFNIIMDVWKARQFNVPVIGTLLRKRHHPTKTLRSEGKETADSTESFAKAAEKLWNSASERLRMTNLVVVAKKEAKELAQTLPI